MHPRFHSVSSRSPLRSARRGSLLITALILAAVIAISLGSFLNLAVQSSRLSYRSFYAGAAMNAAETGLEEGMWAVNKRLAGDTSVWSNNGWTILDTGAVRRTFNLGTVSGGATASVNVYVSSANLVGATPSVIARSIITPKSGPTIEKWINISLAKRSRFSTGLVAKDVIRFSGNNASVDSYDSRLGAYNASLGSGATNRYDRGTAGSSSVQVASVDVGNADIWGYVVVGTSDASGLDVNNGTVGSFDTPLGTVDPSHVMTDFTANFDDVSHPATYTGSGAYTINGITGTTTLPRPDSVDTDSNIETETSTSGTGTIGTVITPATSTTETTDTYKTEKTESSVAFTTYEKIRGDWVYKTVKTTTTTKKTTTFGDTPAADGKYYYNIDGISLQGGTLTIADDVVIRMTPTTGTAISVGGTGSIVINAPSTGKNPKAEIFVEADVKIAGKGVTNDGGTPSDLMLWGTRPQSSTSAQSIDINGNGVLSAVVYAPKADISMHGGGNSGNVYGSMVGNSITVTGNSAFHYDESLSDSDGGEPLGMSEWNEYITYADRATYSKYMVW